MDFEMQLHNEDSNSCSAKKKRRNRKTKVSCGSNNTHHEGDSLVQDVLLQKDSCVESTANVSSNSGLIEVQSNSDMNCSENKSKVKKEKWKRCKARKAVNRDVGLQEVASETKTTPFKIEAPVDESIKPVLEKDLYVEPTANLCSNSGLIEVQHNSNLNFSENKNKRKKERNKERKAQKADNTDVDLHKVASETKIAPFRIEALVDESIKPVSEKDSCVEPTANLSSNSGLTEVQSNSNLNFSENKNKRKRERKKRCNALEADNTDVDLHKVASETKIAPFRIEALVDECIKPVSESTPLEVDVPDDLNKKMDSVAASISSVEIEAAVGTSTKTDPVANLTTAQKRKMKKEKRKQRHKSLEDEAIDHVPDDLNKKMDSVAAFVEIEAAVGTSTKADPVPNLTPAQKRKMKKEKRKQRHKSLEQDAIDHVYPEDNSVTKNTVLEKDTSSLPSINMFSEKQPNGQISLCPEMNEVKELNDGHNDSENKSLANFHMDNGKPYEKKDVKFDLAVAELDLTTVKEDLLVSEKLRNSSKIEDTSLLVKHNAHAESVNIYKRKKIVEKKRRESSDSGENNCIKEDATGFTSFGHSEEPHVTGFSENKLDIELERKNDASVQVSEDIMMRESLVDCSDGKLVCKDNENRMEKKILKEDEENFVQKNRRELKEKTSDSISGFDSFCYQQVQMNAEVETNVGEIFSSSSHLGVTKNDAIDVTGKEDNLLQKSHPSPERVSRCKKKLLVLDVNGLLADIVSYASHGYKPDIMISKKSVFKRPYCDDFLRFCFERFNVGIWSSRIKKNVEKVIEFLMGDSRRNLHFIWDAYHCSKTGLNTIENKDKPLVLKELKKLWDKLEPDLPWEKGEYNETNTLLLDDSPYKALRNPAHTAIFPYSYSYKDSNDCSLGPGGDLRVYLEGLAAAENVQEYVQQNPFGQRAITESNPSWGFYSKIIDIKPRQPHNSSTSVAGSHVVSRMSLEETYIYESGFGSKVTLHQAASASASETYNNNTAKGYSL
ncbi:hypothetical protein LWI28_018993 [Acer negundo]|uniref:FCP1 homology domain-containing protein n=1 Tax=Acer negundo TaxID=4023 RepID=A0AAD5NQE4_ACENE|nr:hypothetical protein LWI28_018993 [Acer negundo]